MLIEPAVNADVPPTVVMRTLSNSAERDFDPPDTLVPPELEPTTPEATQEYAELSVKNKFIAPSRV